MLAEVAERFGRGEERNRLRQKLFDGRVLSLLPGRGEKPLRCALQRLLLSDGGHLRDRLGHGLRQARVKKLIEALVGPLSLGLLAVEQRPDLVGCVGPHRPRRLQHDAGFVQNIALRVVRNLPPDNAAHCRITGHDDRDEEQIELQKEMKLRHELSDVELDLEQ